MKKSYLFLILIFSVFFVCKITYADTTISTPADFRSFIPTDITGLVINEGTYPAITELYCGVQTSFNVGVCIYPDGITSYSADGDYWINYTENANSDGSPDWTNETWVITITKTGTSLVLSPAVSYGTGGGALPVFGYTDTWTDQSCSWIDFSTWGGCLSNLTHSLFFPSTTSLSQFNGLYTQYVNKPPFGYISAIQTALKSINDTGTSIFTLQTLPILDTYIFNPLRLAFVWILWLGFAFLLFKRFKDIQL